MGSFLAMDEDDDVVGLVQNVPGVPFQCGTCKFLKDGHCTNKHRKLYGKKVDDEWCCNKYQHPNMKTIIA